MLKKEPLYFKKSKAAKDFDYDYDFLSEADSFLRESVRSPDRYKLKPQKRSHKYKRTHDDYHYYDDQNSEIRSHDYDENSSLYDSDYMVALEYRSTSSESSIAESVFYRQYEKETKDKKKKPTEKLVYNHNPKYDHIYNNHINKKDYHLNSKNDEFKSNNKDFNVYLSEQPIVFRIRGQDDHPEPLKSLTRKRQNSKEDKSFKDPLVDLKQQGNYKIQTKELRKTPSNKILSQMEQGDSLQINPPLTQFPNLNSQLIFTEQLSNLFKNSADSSLGLVYLPVVVMNHSKAPQTEENVIPAFFVSNNGGLQEEPPKEQVIAFPALSNTDQSNVFDQKTSTKNTKNVSISTKHKSKGNLFEAEQEVASSLEPMLQTSDGIVMSTSSYATLIVGQPIQNSTGKSKSELSLIKSVKKSKKKKSISPHQKPNQIADKQDEKQVSKRNINKQKSVERQISSSNKMTENEEKKLQEMEMIDLEYPEDSQTIVININERSFTSDCLPDSTQTKNKETGQNGTKSEGQSLVNRKHDLVKEKVTLNPSCIQSNINRKSTTGSKIYSGFLLGMGPDGNYKKVGPSQKISLRQTSGFSGKTSDEIFRHPYERDTNTAIYYISSVSHTGEGWKQPPKRNSSQSIQSGERKVSKGILRTEDYNKSIDTYVQGEVENNGYNQNTQGENRRNTQQQNKKLSKSNVNIERKAKSEMIKSQSMAIDSGKEMVPQSAPAVLEDYVDTDHHLQAESDYIDHEPTEEKLGKTSILKSPLEVIYPFMGKNSMNNEDICLQGENKEELTYTGNHISKISEYSEFLIVSFQAVQYIVGVSCYDKLIHVINFFCNEGGT